MKVENVNMLGIDENNVEEVIDTIMNYKLDEI